MDRFGVKTVDEQFCLIQAVHSEKKGKQLFLFHISMFTGAHGKVLCEPAAQRPKHDMLVFLLGYLEAP